MKKLIFIFIVGLSSLNNITKAQINVNVNLGAQPQWGPSGYSHADYYYMPDIETYYSVPTKQFIYLNNGQWKFAPSLPARYSNYNLYNGYKVVLNDPEPYKSFKTHKVKYAKFKNQTAVQATLKNPGKAKAKGLTKNNSYSPKKKVVIVNGNGNNGNNGNGNNGKGNNGNHGKGKH